MSDPKTPGSASRLIVDGAPIAFEAGDSVLSAMLRAGQRPSAGGCLCMEGDCGHCLISVEGVAYVRACQTRARAGLLVARHPAAGYPAMPDEQQAGPIVGMRHAHCDVVVIGQGESGSAAAGHARAAGAEVVTLDAGAGQEVIGIYPGPLVVARLSDGSGMLSVHPRGEIIVATGAAEIQPVATGNHLAGILTSRAAMLQTRAGVPLGKVVAVGTPPAGIDMRQAEGELLRFEGETTVTAVVTRDADGVEHRYACDTVSVGLGLHPRAALARMGAGLNVRAVGGAARESDIPPCPVAGVLCACANVQVSDMQSVWERGFTELELVKRATLAGTGACQGMGCVPHIRSFLAERGGVLQAPFTARPVTRQITIGEIAAGAYHAAAPRSALDAEHRALGAKMERVGGWWRPWDYGAPLEEYWAVREAVSLGDVSTLGKMLVSGPDALALLEHLYPTQVSTIKTGRSRYALLLDDRGYVLDDGLISKDSDTRYALTFTSGGATTAELWVRDWAESLGLNVRILNQTYSHGAINVTGPLARQLLARAGLKKPPGYMAHMQAKVSGVPCRVYRLSFTGELSYELHHPAEHSVALWRKLMALAPIWASSHTAWARY